MLFTKKDSPPPKVYKETGMMNGQVSGIASSVRKSLPTELLLEDNSLIISVKDTDPGEGQFIIVWVTLQKDFVTVIQESTPIDIFFNTEFCFKVFYGFNM